MKQYFRNPWLWLACGFLIVNTYAVFRIGRKEQSKERPSGRAEQRVIDMPDLIPQSAQQRDIHIRSLQQVDMDEKGRAILALTFDRPVDPQVLQRFLRVTGLGREEREPEVQDSGASQRIFVAVPYRPNAALTLTIAKGFYAEEGPERLRRDIVQGIVLESDISLTQLQVRTPVFENPTIALNFSRPVNMTSLRQSLSIEPSVNVIITESRHWHYGRTYLVTGNFEHNRNYTLHVASGLRAESSNIRMHAPIEQAVYIPDATAAIRIPIEGRFLSPHGNMLLPLQSINVTNFVVKAARLPAHNLVQYAMREGRHYRQNWGEPASHITVPETKKTYTLPAPANSNIHHHVSLREVLPDDVDSGAWHISVKAEGNARDQRLLVISDIGITVRHTATEMLVWANSISSLEPIANATVKIWCQAAERLFTAQTDTQGLARVTLKGDAIKPFMVTVAHHDDLAFISLQDTLVAQRNQSASRPYLASRPVGIAGALPSQSSNLEHEAFLYTDRGVYRPGETTYARAIVRLPHLKTPNPIPVILHAFRPDGREHSQHPAMLSAYGTAEFDIDWQDFDATGRYRLELRTPGANAPIGRTNIALEDFVPPRMAVTLDTNVDPAKPLATASIAARYLYGAPAANNRFNISLYALPLDFSPPAFPDYTFGNTDRSVQATTHQIASDNLSDEGLASTTFRLPQNILPPAMIEAIITATVHEQGGRTVSAASRAHMHVYPYYIGIHTTDLQNPVPGKQTHVKLQLVAPNGEKHGAEVPLTVVVEQIDWSTVLTRDSQGHYRYESNRRVTPLRSDVINTDTNGFAAYELDTTITGSLRLRVESAEGISTVHAYHVGTGSWRNRAMDRPDRVELQWDRESYRPGETAILTVISPFPGRALLAVEQDRLLFTDTRLMQGNTTTFHIPVTNDYFPNAHASVHVIRSLPPGDPTASRRAARAIGSLPLRLDPRPHQLQVQITAPANSRPNTVLPIALEVRDPDGSAAQAELALAIVDEAICILTDFRTPDPIGFFMAQRRLPFQISDLYAMLLPETDPETARYHAHTGGDIGSLLRGRLNPVRSRRFRPLAIWQGAIETDANGLATVEIPIPEFSGQVRVMAVAVSQNRKGSAHQTVTINRPFTVLASLPRFLANDDITQMPIELHHTGEKRVPVKIQITSEGPVSIAGSGKYETSIDAGERVSMEIPLRANAHMGTAHIYIKATTPEEIITDTIEMPVRPPAAFRTVHTHIALAAGESIDIYPAKDWYADTLTKTMRISPTPAIQLAGAFDYLTRYPYGCLEQILSTAFAVMYTQDIPLHESTGFIVGNTDAYLRNTINRVISMQTANGGFGWWPHASQNFDWGSIYAMHFLVLARNQGIPVPVGPYDRGLQYLRSLLARPSPSLLPTAADAWQQDAVLRAYICYVFALAGSPNHNWTDRLREQVERMHLDSRLHLVLALAAGGRRRDARELLESLHNIPLPENRSGRASLSSPARSKALHLYAWLEVAPQHPSIPTQVESLLAHQQDGRWRTTQENAAALQALARRLQLTSDMPKTFTGIVSQDQKETKITSDDRMIELDATKPFVLQNEGPGTLHATIRKHGIPQDITDDADNGIRIRRSYMNIQQERVNDTMIRQGDLVVIEIQVDTLGHTRDNLVIADLLPAGLEIENANLRTTELVPWAKSRSNLPVRHIDMRDDRLIIFTEPFSGSRRFYYAVRAVTPGSYTRPPITIEGMYMPEIHSTHHAGEVKVIP